MGKLIILALAATMTLTACSAGTPGNDVAAPDAPTTSPTSTPTDVPGADETPAPTTAPTDGGTDGDSGDGPLEAPAEFDFPALWMDRYAVYIVSADGYATSAFNYFDSPKTTAANLAKLLGVTPTTTTDPNDPQQIASYDFGGVRMTQLQSQELMGRRFTFEVTAESVGGIHIVGPNYWQVGDPAAPIMAQGDSWTDGDVMRVYMNLTPSDSRNQIYLNADDPFTTITSFTFPDGA